MNWRPLSEVEREATGELTLIAWRRARDVAVTGYGLFRYEEQHGGWIGTNTLRLDHHPGFTPACETWAVTVDSPARDGRDDSPAGDGKDKGTRQLRRASIISSLIASGWTDLDAIAREADQYVDTTEGWSTARLIVLRGLIDARRSCLPILTTLRDATVVCQQALTTCEQLGID